ncbi:NAD-dependent succinate-semialdehyde dehydrogenase [Pseudidiomarina sp.]|uniref:NAD-dependent succinate-semialdehyde dehydrogenase n=1 Tax=Pseudidiomarina sp. TaxID=2081707 RepID=UPI003A980B53
MGADFLAKAVDAGMVPAGWFEAGKDDHSRFAVNNPATLKDFAWLDNHTEFEAQQRVDEAAMAFTDWSELPARQRAEIIRRWGDALLAHREVLGALLSYEQGKPLAEALGEIDYSASYLHWFAEEAPRVYGDTVPASDSTKHIMVIKQPVGVVGVITPWNFPMAMLARKASAALAAGCTLVAKPAHETPLSAYALQALARQSGVPNGAFGLVVGTDSAAIGNVLTQHPAIAKFSFTGSTRVGRLLAEKCASTVKRVSLELGGNAPFVVFDDADLEAAVEGFLMAKFRNAGQTCVCANRLLVHEAIADKFIEALKEKITKLELGPLIHPKAATNLYELVQRAVANGAHSEPELPAPSGAWFKPVVLENVSNQSELAQSELFGPVVTVVRFSDEGQALQLANNTEYGLAAYVYTRDIGRCMRMGKRLQFGMVGINDAAISNAAAPFGGMKQSGYGREGSKYGLDDYLETKYLSFGGLA